MKLITIDGILTGGELDVLCKVNVLEKLRLKLMQSRYIF